MAIFIHVDYVWDWDVPRQFPIIVLRKCVCTTCISNDNVWNTDVMWIKGNWGKHEQEYRREPEKCGKLSSFAELVKNIGPTGKEGRTLKTWVLSDLYNNSLIYKKNI